VIAFGEMARSDTELAMIRMLPVFLTLVGMRLRTDEKLFGGWFGPRGLASILFALIVLNEHLPGGDTIALTAVCTIVLSIVGHGLSANPLVGALAPRAEEILSRCESENFVAYSGALRKFSFKPWQRFFCCQSIERPFFWRKSWGKNTCSWIPNKSWETY
jgi:hypothetical protein